MTHVGPAVWKHEHEQLKLTLLASARSQCDVPLGMNARPMQWRSKSTEDERIGMKSLFLL